MLTGWLDRLLGPDGHAAAKDRLAALAADVLGPLRAAHRDAESTCRVLVRYDGVGPAGRPGGDRPGWETQRRGRGRARRGRAAVPGGGARERWGAGARVLQQALLHLYGPESATFTCPVAMADGAAALLSRSDVDDAVRDGLAAAADLHRPGRGDHQRAVDDRVAGRLRHRPRRPPPATRRPTARGGSPARSGSAPPSTRRWRWRWPGPTARARQPGPGAVPGPATRDSPLSGHRPATAPGVRLHRLKDKLGTRAVPTAEVGLRDAEACPSATRTAPGCVG